MRRRRCIVLTNGAGAAIYPDVYPDGGGPVRANEAGQ